MNCLLVIPHYRHVDRLREFLPGLVAAVPPEMAIQVSDDGSGPKAVQELEELLRRPEIGVRVQAPLLAATNRGKGHAIYAAWREAGDVEWLAFVDADGAVSAREVVRAWNHLRFSDAPDVLIGSRVKMLGKAVERTFWRHLSGRVFATLASTLSGLPVYDSQCGLKFVRRSAFERIAAFPRAERFSFDVELLMLLAASGSHIEEFPIDWRDVPGGKVSVLRDSPHMVWELLGARRNLRELSRTTNLFSK